MKFLDYIQENKDNHAVMSFGRMNPITKGHQKLVNKVQQVARQVGGSHHIVLSHSQDKNKNPLSSADKLKHAKRAFPGANLSTSDKESPNYLSQAAKLHKKGVSHLHVVAGSDRVSEFKGTLNKYNGTHSKALYNFKKITVHSSGDRDPDSHGTSGISGTKMRGHATAGNYKAFKSGAPSGMSDTHVKHMFNDVRKGMKVHEDVAVFLIGGPGSGKDFIFKSVMEDFGLTEMNTDKAFEYLISERYETYERTNLVINGNAHEIKNLEKIKEGLEDQGYKTAMVLVSTTDEVSKQRNESRKRMMNEEMRFKKWNLVNMVKPYFEDVFKDDYIEFDNSGEISDENIIDLKEWLESRMSNDIEDIDELFEEYFDEDLRKWFSKDHPEGDWKRIDSKGNVKGPCARKPGEPKPKCMSKAKRAKLSKKERAAAVRAKRKHDPVADRAGKGGKPINVSNFGKGKISEAVTVSITGDTADEVRQFFSGSTPNRREQYELSDNDAVKLLSLKEVVNDSEYVKEVRERGSNKGSGGSISRKKKRNTNQDFNAWYTGSQVEKYYKPNQLSEETQTISEETQKESIDRGIESGMALNSYSKEFVNRRKGGKVVPFKELTGDTTTASIGAQKEDELKKKGISLRTFRAKRPIG